MSLAATEALDMATSAGGAMQSPSTHDQQRQPKCRLRRTGDCKLLRLRHDLAGNAWPIHGLRSLSGVKPSLYNTGRVLQNSAAFRV